MATSRKSPARKTTKARSTEAGKKVAARKRMAPPASQSAGAGRHPLLGGTVNVSCDSADGPTSVVGTLLALNDAGGVTVSGRAGTTLWIPHRRVFHVANQVEGQLRLDNPERTTVGESVMVPNTNDSTEVPPRLQ